MKGETQMKALYLTLSLLSFFGGAWGDTCDSHQLQYDLSSQGIRSADLTVPVRTLKAGWKLHLVFDAPVLDLRAPGFKVRRKEDADNEFHLFPRRKVKRRFPQPGGVLKLKASIKYDADTDKFPGISKLTVPGYSCSIQREAGKGQDDPGKSCPLFSCHGNACENIIKIESNWASGMTAYLNIPIPSSLSGGWEMKILFYSGVLDFENWVGDVTARSKDGRSFLVKNKVWSATVAKGLFKFKFLVRKKEGVLKIAAVQFQPKSCPSLSIDTSTTSAPATTAEAATTNAASTTPSKGCFLFKCNGSECEPHACMRNNWREGTGMSIIIPVGCDVDGWELTLEFNMKLKSLDVWDANVRTAQENTFILVNKDYNQRISNTSLDIAFIAVKGTIKKAKIVRAEFTAITCRSTCSGTSIMTTPSRGSCPVTSCTGTECKALMIQDGAWERLTQGRFLVPSRCALRSWRLVISFEQPFQTMTVWGGEILSSTSDKRQITIKNLCQGLIPAGKGIEVRFRFQGTDTWPKMAVNGIKLTPTECECPPTTQPLTLATTKLPTTEATTAVPSSPLPVTTVAPTSVPEVKTLATTPSPQTTKVHETTQATTDTPKTTSLITMEVTTGASTEPLTTATCRFQKAYQDVLRLSNMFYEAQRSGKLPTDMRVKWRKDSALNDAFDADTKKQIDLEGGYYDAGDYVKFGFPMAAAITNLAWGFLAFEEGYRLAGEHAYGLKTIRWATDYFIKCHPSKFVFYGQVGNGDVDHAYWGRPEDMTMERPAYKITDKKPGSELAGETAAALAASSLVFRRNGDVAYADTLLRHAKELYEFADTYRGNYHTSIPDAAKFYRSYSGYEDELAVAALWLYKATKDTAYLTKVITSYKGNIPGEFSWDNKFAAIPVLLYGITKQQKYANDVKDFCDSIFEKGKRTPGGLVWISQWGSNRHAANVAFLCLVAANDGIETTKYLNFARDQILFMLGKLGSSGRSYVVGYGTNPPQRPHHASSSCPNAPAPCNWSTFRSPKPNPHVLYGALVGGPDEKGNYEDKRSDYIKNEVACDYNAGFQSALAGLAAMAVRGEC